MDISANMNGQGGNGDALVKVSEAAKGLSVSPRTVWRMIADGQLRAVHVRGCTRVYRLSVEEYLKQNEMVGCI